MQIHELNNFTGTLGSGAYLAVDDGNDTGKLSTQQLLAATEARIDNIIAGPAPSAEEIVDARRGADGVTYNSLGTAIRTQVTDLKSDLSIVDESIEPLTGYFMGAFHPEDFESGTLGWQSSSQKWAYWAYNKNVRTKENLEYKLKAGDVVSLKDYTNARFMAFCAKEDGTFWRSGWQSADFDVPYDGYYAFVLANNPEVTVTNVTALSNLLVIKTSDNTIATLSEATHSLTEAVPLKKYEYKASEVYSGTLQATGITSGDSSAFAIPQKIALAEGENITINATLPVDATDVQFRIVGYANSGMDEVAGTVVVSKSGSNGYQYIQPAGYSFVLIGAYYTKSGGSAYADILNAFNADDVVLTVTKGNERSCVSETDVLETVSDAEYLNICMQSGNAGSTLVNSRTTTEVGGSRAVYKLPIEKGDIITFGVNDNWIKTDFQYQYIFTNESNIIIASNWGAFLTANKSDKIRFIAPVDGLVYIAYRNSASQPLTRAVNPLKVPNEAFVIKKEDAAFVDNILICDSKTVYADDGKRKKILPTLSTQFCVHRGWADAPNNTLQAFWNGKRNGYSLMECDVRYSSDGILLLAHDDTITGTVNGQSVTYTVANETFATLEQLVFPNAFYNCSVPSLDDVLAFGRSAQIKYLFDCKVPSEQMAVDMISLVKKYHMIDDVIFNTNGNTVMANKLVELEPNVNIAFAISSTTDAYDSYLNREGKTYLSVGISALDNTISTAEYFALAEKGFIMGVWSVDNTSINKAVSVAPYFIEMTDASKSNYDWFTLVSDAIMSKFDVSFQ